MNNTKLKLETFLRKFLRKQENLKILIVSLFLLSIVISGIVISKIEAYPNTSYDLSLSFVEGNSILAVSNPFLPEKPAKKVKMIVTAYSSTTWQTDSTPFITAAGTYVREGIVANNMLPFGTEIRIPEIYGDKVFVVEDRMHQRKGYYHVDIWFPEYWQAKNFGAKNTYIEILEN